MKRGLALLKVGVVKSEQADASKTFEIFKEIQKLSKLPDFQETVRDHVLQCDKLLVLIAEEYDEK